MNYAGPFVVADFRLAPALRFSLRSTSDNAVLAFQMCWPWLAILTGLELAAMVGPGYPLSLLLPGVPAPARVDAALVALIIALKLIAISSLAVSWSRFLLLGEIATGWDRLRVDRPVWRFCCNALLIWFACSGIFLLGALISFVALPLMAQFTGYPMPEFPRAVPASSDWLKNPWTLIITASLVLGVLGGLPVVQRLSIKLVAIALGREDYGLGDAWRDSGGQPLRLFSFTFAITALVVAVWVAAGFAIWQIGSASAAGLFASAVAAAVASGLTVILATASVSVLFGLFVEGREV
jgi:hypothetical protein